MHFSNLALSQLVPTTARDAALSVPAKARQARRTPAVRKFARLGIGSRAAIYALLTYMTVDIAVSHRAPSVPGGSGALQVLAKQPGGHVLTGLLAFGLAGYAAWRVLQVLSPGEPGRSGNRPAKNGRHKNAVPGKAESQAHSVLERAGWAGIAIVYAGLSAQAVQLCLGSGTRSGGGSSSHPRPLVATVLRWPGGPGWVGLVGVGIGIGGVSLVIWAFSHDYSRSFDKNRMGKALFGMARAAAMAGDLARGALVALVSVYLVTAAVTDTPSHAKGLGGALYSFDRLAAGPALLLVAAAGLACFAAFSVLEALYRRL